MVRYILLIITLIVQAIPSTSQDARELVRKTDEHSRGNTSVSSLTIRTIRPGWSREMTLKVWTRGRTDALILIQSPARDKGIAYLRKSREVWNWIPSIERNIKLPPSMMSQSWMGTDFTNDDLVKEASIVEDYTHTLLGQETIDGRSCHKIRMVPLPEAAVVWGKVLLWIDRQEMIILHAEYYDETGELVNTLHASDIRMLGGRSLPARLEMRPADKKGEMTVMLYHSVTFDQPLADRIFTTQYMSKAQ
jgi:outer membrane lipoprotein-sorting protein